MSSVKSRREQYSEATRTALLETATTLFAERGFAATALGDVAAAAGVTRGAVYHHFSSKQELFEAVLEALETKSTDQVAEAAARFDDAWESAMAGLNAFLDQCCEPVYGRLVWQEGPLALGWQRWQECEKKYAYGMTEQFVHSLIDAKYLEPISPHITTKFAFALLGEIGSTLADTPDAEKPKVREECVAVLRRLLSGLRP